MCWLKSALEPAVDSAATNTITTDNNNSINDDHDYTSLSQLTETDDFDNIQTMVAALPNSFVRRIYKIMYNAYVYGNESLHLQFDNINHQIIDSFLAWWCEKPGPTYFSIEHFFTSKDAYIANMCSYLQNNECRWIAFFRARTGILTTDAHLQSAYLFNFFYDDECVDRDILASTYQPEYARRLQQLQYEASERYVYIILDKAMTLLWLCGAKEFHRQRQRQASLRVHPNDAPRYGNELLYIVDWSV